MSFHQEAKCTSSGEENLNNALSLAPVPVERPARPRPEPVEVRLHAPIPQAVIVRIDGTVDESATAVVAARVGEQLRRVDHVVLDLGGVADLHSIGVSMLLDLNRAAARCGATLHVTGADREAISRPLRRAVAEHLLTFAPAAETVIALLTPDPM